MSNPTIIQQLRTNIQQINVIKTQNRILLSQLVSSDKFLDLLNDTRLSAEPIETYVIDNTIQIKYSYKNLGFKIILTDKEIVNTQIEKIFKDKVSTKIEKIDDNLNSLNKAATKIMESFNNDKK